MNVILNNKIKNLDELTANKKNSYKKRIQTCLDKYNYTQSELAKLLNTIYVSGDNPLPISVSQTSISRWTGKGKKGLKGFPELENILLLADFFDVNVGYLLGETDCETFTAEKASNYLGLNEDAIKSIRKATSFDTAYRTARASEQEVQTVLNKLFTSKSFFRFIHDLIDLENLYTGKNQDNKILEDLCSELGDELFTEALNKQGAHWEYKDNPDPKLVEAVNRVSDAIDEAYRLSEERLDKTDVVRYRLQKSFNNLIDELYPE